MTKNHEADEASLTSQQATALPLLASGAKKKDAAAVAGVCPQTISEWLREAHFCAALQSMREELTALAAARLGEAADAAVFTILELMKSANETIRLKAATYILDRVLLLQTNCPLPTPQEERSASLELLIALGVNCK